MTHDLPDAQRRSIQWLPIALLVVVIATSVLGTLHWIDRNEMLFGRDASAYLLRSLSYQSLGDTLTLQGLFRILTEHPYRTPAIYLLSQPFMALFGADVDGAQVLNASMLALLLLLVWMLAREITGPWTALLATTITAFLPMIAAMSRLYYTEMLLTVTVVLALLALYRTDGFRRRRWSLLLGAALGIGLLVKWTMPVYLAGPLLYVALAHRKGMFSGWRFRPMAAAIGVAVGIVFIVIWYWPNREVAASFQLGGWLAVGWFLLAAGSTYFALGKRAPIDNLLAALVLASLIASLWYMPHFNFIESLISTDAERGSIGMGVWGTVRYVRYTRYFYQFHTGPLVFWTLIPLGIAPWVWAWTRRRSLAAHTAILWISIATSFLVLAILSQSNPRNLVPVLPQAAILLAIGLAAWAIPWRYAILPAVLVPLVLQWTTFTTDAAYGWSRSTAPLWLSPYYAVPPSSGVTDPGLWVAPTLIATIAQSADTPTTIGNLVNEDYFHRGQLRYLIQQQALPIEIVDLTEETATWGDLISSNWLVLKDGTNQNVEPEGQAIVARIAAGDSLFSSLFSLQATLPLSNGETVSLYRRTQGPGHPKARPEADAQAASVVEAIHTAWREPARLYYTDSAAAVWVGRLDPVREEARILPADVDEAIRELETASGTLVVVATPDSQELVDRLSEIGYFAGEAGGDMVWMVLLGRPGAPLQEARLEGTLSGSTSGSEACRIDTRHLQTLPSVAPGEILPIELEVASNCPEAKWSVRLLDGQGTSLTTIDRWLQSSDRFGLLVPAQTAPGTYTVALVAYNGASLQPIVDSSGSSIAPSFEVEVLP